MTRKELNLAIFAGTTNKVLWQPRIEMCMHERRRSGPAPVRLRRAQLPNAPVALHGASQEELTAVL